MLLKGGRYDVWLPSAPVDANRAAPATFVTLASFPLQLLLGAVVLLAGAPPSGVAPGIPSAPVTRVVQSPYPFQAPQGTASLVCGSSPSGVVPGVPTAPRTLVVQQPFPFASPQGKVTVIGEPLQSPPDNANVAPATQVVRQPFPFQLLQGQVVWSGTPVPNPVVAPALKYSTPPFPFQLLGGAVWSYYVPTPGFAPLEPPGTQVVGQPFPVQELQGQVVAPQIVPSYINPPTEPPVTLVVNPRFPYQELLGSVNPIGSITYTPPVVPAVAPLLSTYFPPFPFQQLVGQVVNIGAINFTPTNPPVPPPATRVYNSNDASFAQRIGGSVYLSEIPSLGAPANRAVQPPLVLNPGFPFQELSGSFIAPVTVAIPIPFTSPPNFECVIVRGYPQPDLRGFVVQIGAIQDTYAAAPLRGLQTESRGNPDLGGRVVNLQVKQDQGQSSPNVAAYATRVAQGYPAPHLQGSVVAPVNPGYVPFTDRVPLPLQVVRGWQPYPQGFIAYAGLYSQIDHNLQVAIQTTGSTVYRSQQSQAIFPAGSVVWTGPGAGRQDAPTGQQRLSPTLVLNPFSTYPAAQGSFWISGRPQFPQWDMAPQGVKVYQQDATPRWSGRVWQAAPALDLRSRTQPTLVVQQGWQPLSQGSVQQLGAPRSWDKSSPLLQAPAPSFPPIPGQVVYLGAPKFQLPQPVGIFLVPLARNPVLGYPGFQGFVWQQAPARGGVGPTYFADYAWQAGQPSGGWTFVLEPTWQLAQVGSWIIKGPME